MRSRSHLEAARSRQDAPAVIQRPLARQCLIDLGADKSPFAAARPKATCALIEDCCDALGSTYPAARTWARSAITRHVSFYPAHHITMGEGGAVIPRDGRLKRVAESMRDWGRDCWCEPGKDNTCNKRFGWQLGELPCGYDHKYTYSNIGYNLKATDMQAALGVSQMDKLPEFIERRKANFAYLKSALKPLEEFLALPEATPDSDPTWFGFPIGVKAGAPRLRAPPVDTKTLENRRSRHHGFCLPATCCGSPRMRAGSIALSAR